MKKISIFTPCYNEEGNIIELYNQVTETMKLLSNYDYEYIFIDNKSTDNTRNILRNLAEKDKRVKVIFNLRNYGPDRSGIYGFLQTTGDVSICLAADLQDPPQLIPEFIKSWESGYKVVWGQKSKSKENKLMYFIRSLYYCIIGMFSKNKQYKHVTGFGLYDKEVMRKIRETNDSEPLLRYLITEFGYEVKLIQYEQPRRQSGNSHYNFAKYFDTAISSLISTSRFPLRLVTYIGIICSLISFCIAIFYLVMKLIHWKHFTLGTAPILIGIFMLGGIQILSIGIIGEYLSEVLDRVIKRPRVIEEERINFEEEFIEK